MRQFSRWTGSTLLSAAVCALLGSVVSCTSPTGPTPAATKPSTMSGNPAPVAQAPADPHLIHRYSFLTDAKDSAGKVDGKLFGDAAIVDGKLVIKNASAAAPSYLEFSGSLLPTRGNTMSLEMWFMANELPATFTRLLNIGNSSSNIGNAFIYVSPHVNTGSARVAISATLAAAKTVIDVPAWDDGKPHMIAVVIDSDMMHLFVDGTEPKPAVSLGNNTLDKVEPVENWIGKSPYVADGMLAGSIDEFRVYDRALTAADITAAYKAGPDAVLPAAPAVGGAKQP